MTTAEPGVAQVRRRFPRPLLGPRLGRRRRAGGRRRERTKGRGLQLYTWGVIAWLFLPIVVMILFGFNNTHGKFNYTWQGFTLNWYKNLFAVPDLTHALENSLSIAAINTVVATTLGTGIGMALGKYRFRGRGGINLMLFSTFATPEVVLGSALLSLFITFDVARGYLTIVIAHVMFSIAFVAVTVRARMVGFDHSLEEAARDLGAGAWTTFRKITLPLMLPAIVAGGLLAFALSIDDYIITTFNAGQTVTFPLWVFGATRVGVPPQVNVMGTLIFVIGVTAAVMTAVVTRRRER
jgi:spermidine/putrescine transport system permease protein